MRITGGRFKGRRLSPIKGLIIRPTPDHVREAIFSIIGQDLTDYAVLDLFAGTGVLSLEAISRGASLSVLVDRSPRSLEVIRKNISLCGVRDQVRLLRSDLPNGLGSAAKLNIAFDLAFADPPYDQGLVAPTLAGLDSAGILANDALVVVEHSPRESLGEPTIRLRHSETRNYGQSCVSLFIGI